MKHEHRLVFLTTFLVTVAAASALDAQSKPPAAATSASTPTTPATPTPAAEAAPVAGDPPPTAAIDPVVSSSPLLANAGTCFPSCRKGYVCRVDQCVSICNPVCGPGEICTEAQECVERAPRASEVILPPPVDPGAEKHDGFYLQLAVGVGGAGAERETSAGKYKYSGPAGFFSVDVGAAVADDLIVFGRLREFGISEPTVKLDNEKLGNAEDETLAFGMLGAGISYYFMPINLHVGGAIGFAQATARIPGGDNNASKVGFGLDLDVGKEWWVSDQWGLGIAARISASDVPPSDGASMPDKHLTAGAFGLLFTATYN